MPPHRARQAISPSFTDSPIHAKNVRYSTPAYEQSSLNPPAATESGSTHTTPLLRQAGRMTPARTARRFIAASDRPKPDQRLTGNTRNENTVRAALGIVTKRPMVTDHGPRLDCRYSESIAGIKGTAPTKRTLRKGHQYQPRRLHSCRPVHRSCPSWPAQRTHPRYRPRRPR